MTTDADHTQGSLPRFLLPSLLGAGIFLLPVHHDGAWTILLGIASDGLKSAIGDAMPSLLLTVLSISALLSLATTVFPPWHKRCATEPLLTVFSVSGRWLLLRVLGALCAWLIVLEVGPEFIWSELTGGVALYGLAAQIITIFLCASLLLPMLTDYGLMEFIGALLQPVFRRLFTLPGRAAVDALASWLSSAPVGVLITISQYERGYYSRREAVVIATNFSITSLPFCLFVVSFIGLRELFFPLYGTAIVIGICCAVALPRLPPLRGLRDLPDAPAPAINEGAAAAGLFGGALHAARQRATTGPGPRDYLRASLQHVLDTWMGLLPIVVLIGTLGLAVAEFTAVMDFIARPLTPLLQAVGLPEAEAAAATFLAGFFDMFLPAAMGQSIESELTRYVIAAVSLTQLIYLSEVGALLLRSSLRVSLPLLLSLFLLRTAIALPIALASAHWVLGT